VRTVHAEANAIAQAARNGVAIEGRDLHHGQPLLGLLPAARQLRDPADLLRRVLPDAKITTSPRRRDRAGGPLRAVTLTWAGGTTPPMSTGGSRSGSGRPGRTTGRSKGAGTRRFETRRVALALLLAALVAWVARKRPRRKQGEVDPEGGPQAAAGRRLARRDSGRNVLDSRQGDQPVNPPGHEGRHDPLGARDARAGPPVRDPLPGPRHGRPQHRHAARRPAGRGRGDPDFHVENAMLVLAELDRLGIRA